MDGDISHEGHSATVAKYDERWSTKRLKWGSLPQVRSYLARKLDVDTGDDQTVDALAERLKRIAPAKARGISIGCGPAKAEIELLKQGVVDRFVVFDLSPVAIEAAQRAARQAGVADRLECRVGDGFKAPDLGEINLVFWKSALHHMFDTREAVRWSRDVLAPGGVFFAFEYIGPTRRQYERSMLRTCNSLLRMLPEHIMTPGPDSGLKEIPARLRVPTPEKIEAKDPSETADSGNILPAFKDLMPGGVVTPVGGTAGRLVLTQIAPNLKPGRDDKVIDFLLAADDILCDRGIFYNALLEWTKPA